ncbi:MAG TPA: alpha/beta hydrolase [Steroidobacteraceae bacterium]|nr:alpha/beta hydrolase [Steroidobacteraceae bacterium]
MISDRYRRTRPGTAGALLSSLSLLCLLVPVAVRAQSVAQVQSYQDFEAAKAANDAPQALAAGERAIQIAADERAEPQLQIDLLRSVAEYAAQAGESRVALSDYQRALTLQEAALGRDHPDLVPVLLAVADLQLKLQNYQEAEAALQRVLAIQRAVFGEHHPNVDATLQRLRVVYVATNDSAGVARVDAELKPAAATTRGLGAPGSGPARYNADAGFATVRVFYGTNRARTGQTAPADFYGKARGDLQYGYLDVTIPKTHQIAELESPQWTDFSFTVNVAADRRKFVLLDKVVPLSQPAFVDNLKLAISKAPSRDVFIFVHGYNNTFEDAARRAAQLAYDLNFDGTPIVYSWPSQASATAYTVDEGVAPISGIKLAEFLNTVVTQSGAARVHLIAHSMGNRVLIEALQSFLARRGPDQRQHVFGQIVFTAPDVDRDYFEAAFDELQGVAERLTLYASDSDYALRTSQIVHGAPRAGSAGASIIRLKGLDTIDMSGVPADALGHSYFAANGGAIYDLFRLLWRSSDTPDQPQRCSRAERAPGSVTAIWRFNVDACKGAQLLAAGEYLKQYGAAARQHVLNQIAALTDPSQKQDWQLILERLNVLLTNTAPGARTQ